VEPDPLAIVLLSLRVAAVATFGAALVGVPTAWWLARRDFPGKVVVEALVALPLVLPPVVTGYALLLLFGRRGLIGEALGLPLSFTWVGAAIAAGVVGFPLMVRALRQGIEAVDPGLEAAVRTLGASPMRTFLEVTLPLAAPGLVTGSLLCFARALGEFGATITFAGNVPGETRTLTLAIWSALQTTAGEDQAAVLVGVSVALAVGAVALGELVGRRLQARVEP